MHRNEKSPGYDPMPSLSSPNLAKHQWIVYGKISCRGYKVLQKYTIFYNMNSIAGTKYNCMSNPYF